MAWLCLNSLFEPPLPTWGPTLCVGTKPRVLMPVQSEGGGVPAGCIKAEELEWLSKK